MLYLAQHDVLTGLENRSMFTAAIDRATTQAFRMGNTCAVLCLDLDYFKDVNDTRGHRVGDRLLRLVAERLRAAVRLDEPIARLGGDEFAILLDGPSNPENVADLANRLIVSIGNPFVIEGTKSYVGASIGVAIYGRTPVTRRHSVHADIALYRAKAEGRQTYRFFSNEMDEEVRSRVRLTDELRLAIANAELFLVYQPQVKATNGRIIGVKSDSLATSPAGHPHAGVFLACG